MKIFILHRNLKNNEKKCYTEMTAYTKVFFMFFSSCNRNKLQAAQELHSELKNLFITKDKTYSTAHEVQGQQRAMQT